MPAPVLSSTGERLYDQLEPIAGPDADNGWPLAIYADAYAEILRPLDELVSDSDDDVPGYAHHLFAPDTEPAEWLPVSEFFVGNRPVPAISDADRRDALVEAPGRKRSTPKAIRTAPLPYLTGLKRVTLYTRDESAYGYVVITYQAETPDEALVRAAVDAQKPAGFNGIYRNDPGWSIGQMEDAYEGQTIGDLEGDWATLDDLEHHLP